MHPETEQSESEGTTGAIPAVDLLPILTTSDASPALPAPKAPKAAKLPSPSKPKRGPGRPRKNATNPSPNPKEPKRSPGRPRKSDAAPKRGPGRPRKIDAAPAPKGPKRGPGRPRKIDGANAERRARAPRRVRSSKPYLPSPGTFPAQLFTWLVDAPAPNKLLVALVRQNGLVNKAYEAHDKVGAALYDLVRRGVVIRLDPETRKPIRAKNARGALYAIEPEAKAYYLEHRSEINVPAPQAVAPHVHAVKSPNHPTLPMPSMLAANGVTTSLRDPRPTRMPDGVFSYLRTQREALERQIASIDAMIGSWR